MYFCTSQVHLLNTRYSGAKAEVKMWQAHVNAVFDLAWVHGEAKLVTGSGPPSLF